MEAVLQSYRRRLFAAFLLVIASTVAPALAQRTTGTLRGTVRDTTKSVLPGVTVTALQQSTGLSRSTTTNADGTFIFSDLPVGTYRIEVGLSGFKSAVRTDIVLNVADDRALDFELPPGDIKESVTVAAASVHVKTIGGDVSGLITGDQVRELPLNGRNFLQLATLMPGVSAPDFLNVKDKGLLGGSDLSVSGSDVTANLWTVDGANNNDVGSNRTILVYPSLEAIEEFKILRNSYGPEFGQAGGAQINIVTRGGTNELRGNVFYSGRSDALNSTNYFLEQAGQPKDQLKRNDFGATLGGPIIKDKLHFFGSVEWNLEKRGTVRTAFVPTAQERAGDFSGAGIAGCSPPVPVDPLTGSAFPGNKIPADRLSPGGKAFLSLYPLPNTTPSGGSCNNWVTSLNTPIDWGQFNGRVDYTISNTSRLMVRYTQDMWHNNAPNLYTNLWGDDPFPAVDSNWNQPGRSFVTQLNSNLGSRAVNSLQFSYSGNSITVDRGGTNPELNSQVNSLIPPLFPDSQREYGADRGHPVFWGGSGYQTPWNEAPFHNNQDLFIFKDDYTAVFGKHFLKVGGLASVNKKNEDVGGYGSYENSAFWGATGLNGWGGTTQNVLADFLLKDMAFGFTENSAQRQVPQRWRDLEGYVADSWKATSRLTVDYGIRYSYFVNPFAADNKIMSFDPSAFNPALGGDPCNGLLEAPGTRFCQDAGFLGGAAGPNRSLYPQDKNNFAPRLGIAWDVAGDGKSAIRAGLGQFFLRERLSPGLNIGANPPFVTNVNGARLLDSAVDPCGCFSTGNGAPNSGREQRAATPNNWQWNISAQREIFRNTTLDVAYVGNYGYDLLRSYDANQVRVGDVNNNGISDRLEFARNQGFGEVRPYSEFGDHRITFWDHSGASKYHSLQSQIISRFGRSQFQASYTLSRTRANLSLDDSSGGLSAAVSSLDLDNPQLDWGLAAVDRTHIFNAALVLGLPSLQNHPTAIREVFGSWEVGTIIGAGSGTPITVTTGSVPGLPGGGLAGTGYTDNQRPNRVASEPCHVDGALAEQWLNPKAFTIVGIPIGTNGNETRGECRGPGYFQTDLSLYKNIRTSNRVGMQLRFEIFNLFNRVNFLSQNFNSTMGISSATFDTGDGATANTVTAFTPSGTFGQATRTRDARQAQFGFKILF